MIGDILSSVGGDIVSGIFGQMSANKQMRFQKNMYRKRYQYQMEDMAKAGLNPILAYKQGPPGAPSGASATMPPMGANILKAKRSSAERQLLNAQKDAQRADTLMKGALAIKAAQETDNLETQNEIQKNEVVKSAADADYMLQQVFSAKTQAQKDKIIYDLRENNPFLYKLIVGAGDVMQELGIKTEGSRGEDRFGKTKGRKVGIGK